MKNLGRLTSIFFFLGILMGGVGCRKKTSDAAFSFTLSPSVTTALNVPRKTCTDLAAKAFDPTISDTISGNPGAAKFQKMTITWKNTSSKLNIYAMRITGADGQGEGIDITLSSADFASFVFGSGYDTSVKCKFCQFEKSEGDNAWTVTINEATNFLTYKGVDTGLSGCGPVISGLPVPKSQVGDVNISLKATLMAYSEDEAGNINNEYASYPFSVKFQAPP